MYFAFISYHLLFLIFFVQACLGKKHRQWKNELQDLKQAANESNKSEKFIKKSDLEELVRLKNLYFVRNYIEEFETNLAPDFGPDWNKVDVFSSPARRSIEIHRQKWEYVFNNFNDSHIVKRLNSEIQKAKIDRTTFCSDMAEIYFNLSDNAYVFNKQKTSEPSQDPLQQKSVLVFMSSISNSNLNHDQNEETIQLPKSLYIELMRKDANVAFIKHHHQHRLQRLKEAYRKKLRQVISKENLTVDSEISSY